MLLAVKTTIDISDPLLKKARTVAAQRGTTPRALVEQGLRHMVTEKSPRPFKLRDAGFRGEGRTSEFARAAWNEILDAASDRGR